VTAGALAGLVPLLTGTVVLEAVLNHQRADGRTGLRRRLQWLVDRRFNRDRYDADRMVDAFASRLQDAVDLDTVWADLAAVVRGALEPAQVSVWISGGGP
jgi:hypothetical protein